MLFLKYVTSDLSDDTQGCMLSLSASDQKKEKNLKLLRIQKTGPETTLISGERD